MTRTITRTDYSHTGEQIPGTWERNRVVARKGTTISAGSDTSFAATSGTPTSLCSDGTSIWTLEKSTNLLQRFNAAGALQESTSTLPSGVSGDFAGAEYYHDGTTGWIYCLVVSEGTPSSTCVVRYDGNDLATLELVKDISSHFTSPRAGGSIAKCPNSSHWIIGEARGPAPSDFRQHLFMYKSDSFTNPRRTVLVQRYEGQGFLDATFKGNQLYLTTAQDEWFVFHFDYNAESFTLVNVHDVSGVSTEGIYWDGSTFLGFNSANVIDIDTAANSKLVMFATINSEDTYAHGIGYAEVSNHYANPQERVGISTPRTAGGYYSFTDIRVRRYTENPAIHGAWTTVRHQTPAGDVPYDGRLRRRKKRKPDWQLRDEREREFLEYLQKTYLEAIGEAPPKEIVETVRPYTRGRVNRSKPPAVSRVDFARLAKSAEAVERLLELAQQARDDEEVAVLLLLH